MTRSTRLRFRNGDHLLIVWHPRHDVFDIDDVDKHGHTTNSEQRLTPYGLSVALRERGVTDRQAQRIRKELGRRTPIVPAGYVG